MYCVDIQTRIDERVCLGLFPTATRAREVMEMLRPVFTTMRIRHVRQKPKPLLKRQPKLKPQPRLEFAR